MLAYERIFQKNRIRTLRILEPWFDGFGLFVVVVAIAVIVERPLAYNESK